MNFKQVVEETRETSMKETTATLSDDGLTYVEPITVIYRFTEQELDQAMTKAAMAVLDEIERLHGNFPFKIGSEVKWDRGVEFQWNGTKKHIESLKQQLSEKEALSALKE